MARRRSNGLPLVAAINETAPMQHSCRNTELSPAIRVAGERPKT